jgi:ParB family chromosome partitioning protein
MSDVPLASAPPPPAADVAAPAEAVSESSTGEATTNSTPTPVEHPTPLEPPRPVARPRPTLVPLRTAGRPALLSSTSLSIELIEPDAHFRLRPEGDVAGLATSLARMGQLLAIDVRPRGGGYQVVTGFRRLAALRFLQRGTVLARIHEGLTDSEAWVYALAEALETRALLPEEIQAVRARLDSEGALTTMARGLIDAAITAPGSDLEPEDRNAAEAADEVDLDELAQDLHARLNGISQDLALCTELWTALDPEPRAALLDQLRYYGELHAYLSRLR